MANKHYSKKYFARKAQRQRRALRRENQRVAAIMENRRVAAIAEDLEEYETRIRANAYFSDPDLEEELEKIKTRI